MICVCRGDPVVGAKRRGRVGRGCREGTLELTELARVSDHERTRNVIRNVSHWGTGKRDRLFRRRCAARQSRMGIYRPLSPNAEELLKTRYSLRNEAGDLTEDFPALVDRVAGALAGAEGRPVDVLSCPDAIARAIGMSLDECADGPVRSTPLDVCPACGGPREPGRCGVCLSCWRGGCEGEVREGVHARDENC